MRKPFILVGPPLLAAGIFLFALSGDFRAQDKGTAENRKLDEAVRNFLLEVTQKGIELYNKQRDYEGCARIYGRALLAVEPLLGHRPELQQAITAGITKAQQTSAGWQHAFALREVLDRVRGGLATPGGPGADKKPPVDKVMPPTDSGVPDKAPADRKILQVDKPAVDSAKPADKGVKDLPPTDAKKTDAPKEGKGPNPNEAKITGRVTYQGKPLPSGAVVLVGAGGKKSMAPINADGSYQFRNLSPGEYRVAIASGVAPGKGQIPPVVIPERYQNENTSGLYAKLKRDENLFDINLQ